MIKNPEVSVLTSEGGILLERQAPPVKSFQRWFAKPHRFELESIGAFVWDELDGQKTAHTIAQRLASHHQLSMREAETALAAFLEMLLARDLVQIVEPKRGKRK